MKSMTKEQRSEFARQGALAMLEKKRAKQVELTPLETTVSKKSPSRKRRPVKQRVSRNDKVFEQALASAEQEYVIAIKEHADHSAKLALLNMRIPALQRTIAVLRQQQNPGSGMVPYRGYRSRPPWTRSCRTLRYRVATCHSNPSTSQRRRRMAPSLSPASLRPLWCPVLPGVGQWMYSYQIQMTMTSTYVRAG